MTVCWDLSSYWRQKLTWALGIGCWDWAFVLDGVEMNLIMTNGNQIPHT